MSGGFPQEWFLELNGKRTGPFSPEQLLGLLADGEIPETVTVIPKLDSGTDESDASMTAAAMREAYFHDDRLPAAKTDESLNRTFSQDPSSIPTATDEPNSEAATDLATARRLFELFQTAKETRAKFAPKVTEFRHHREASGLYSLTQKKGPLLAALAASLVAVIGFRLMTRSPTSGEDTQRELAQSKLEARKEVPPPAVRREERPVFSNTPKTLKFQNNWKPPTRSSIGASPPRPSLRSKPSQPQMTAPPPQPAPAQPQEQTNWAEAPSNPPGMINTQPYQPPEGYPPTPYPNQLAADAGLNPGQPQGQPVAQPLEPYSQDPNQNPAWQPPPQPPEQPQDYRVE